jgi:hypothetical protein
MSQTKAQLIDGKSAEIEFTGGSASGPAISFTGDSNTGIYSPGADQVAVATNGTGRLFVDASGNVGLKVAAPSFVAGYTGLQADGGGNGSVIKLTNSTTGSTSADGFDLILQQGGSDAYVWQRESAPLIFGTAATERLRITSAGLVGIGTSSPSKKLEIANGDVRITDGYTISWGDDTYRIFRNGSQLRFDTNGSQALTIDSSQRVGLGLVRLTEALHVVGSAILTGAVSVGTTASATSLQFPAVTGWGPRIQQGGASINDFGIFTNNTEHLTVKNSGNVGIGTSAPSARFQVESTGANTLALFTNPGVATVYIGISGQSENYYDANTQIFRSGTPTERMRIDASGRLLVGTSASPTGGDAQYSKLVVKGYVGDNTGYAPIALMAGTNGASLASGAGIGRIEFCAADSASFAQITASVDGTTGSNDYPGRLTFSTTADGASSPTERMRITNSGYTIHHAPGWVLEVATAAASGTTDRLIYGVSERAAAGAGGGNQVFIVYSNGNVVNFNNSYGSISDIKLKENIVDAHSQWDDLKALQVRNYNFKEGQTHTQIGLVAQEVELVSPGLVSESPTATKTATTLALSPRASTTPCST